MHTIPSNLPEFPKREGSMTVQEQFAGHMRRKRKIQRLSQTQLGFIVDTSHSAISRIELGRGNPSLDLIQRIASALELECILYVRPRR
jgi:transcriptional regulator with XRE-family HTH domain